jgi:hypothetical protein
VWAFAIWKRCGFEVLSSLGGGSGRGELAERTLSLSMGGGRGDSAPIVAEASGKLGRSIAVSNVLATRSRRTGYAPPRQIPATWSRRLSQYRDLEAVFVGFLDGWCDPFQTTACCAESPQTLGLGLSAFSFSPLRFPLFLFDQQRPPAGQVVAPLGEHVFDDHVDVDACTAHALQRVFLQIRCEWGGLLEFEYGLLLRGEFRKPWML